MEETSKVVIVISVAIIMSIIGSVFYGLLGAILGFLLTLFVFGLFVIWEKMR